MQKFSTIAVAIGAGLAFTATASPALAADKLIKNGQMVQLDFASGPASKAKGSRGDGKFSQGLDEAKGIFGPAKVMSHTATSLRFKGKVDDCTLKADRTVSCKSGSKGVWR